MFPSPNILVQKKKYFGKIMSLLPGGKNYTSTHLFYAETSMGTFWSIFVSLIRNQVNSETADGITLGTTLLLTFC